jgi:hypothetical protein
MKKRLPLVVGAIALGSALLGTSCTTKTGELPTPEIPVGPSITGAVQPAGAVLGVSLADTATHQRLFSTAPNSQGAYQFAAVSPGTYELYFDKRTGYVRPRQRRVRVTAGQTTAVPVVVVVPCTGSVTANGAALPAPLVDLSLGFDGKTLLPPALFSLVLGDGSLGGAGGTYRLYLSLPYAVRVGSYSLDGAAAYAIFHEFPTGVFDSRLPLPPAPSGGTLTITAVENTAPYPRSVSGSFRFTGTDPARGTQKTVSGTFDNAYF